MAEAAASVADEAGTRSTSTGSRRSQRDYRRRRQRHCPTLTSATVGTTDDDFPENVDHGSGNVPDEEPNDRVLRRRGAVRDRRRRYMDIDGTATAERLPRRPLFEENLMMGEPMMLDRIDGLNDAWDAGRFVAVLRQRRDLLFGVTEHDLINALIGDDGFGVMGDRVEHVFPVGESRFTECVICMEFKNLHLRACCNLATCDDCLRNYLSTQVGQAIIKIQCIGADCSALMHRDEILARLSGADKARYAQFLIDANCDPLRRTCPRCSHVLTVDAQVLSSADKYGLMVTCTECQLDWCFPCHAPWHAHLKCSEFLRGDKLLKAWAREQHYGQVNAQKCPKCKFYIQRSSGCDHMTCSRCKTDFCYRCGERFRELKFVGNHYSKLSIFGCKYRFKPTQPVQRRLIRGSIFAAQLMAVPALGALALGAGAIVASVGSLVLPFYAGYKLHKKLERRRSAKRRRRAREAMWHKLEDMRWRGEELDISHPMLTELDTSQIIRSYIGVELAPVDGTVSTSDDAASGLTSNRDFNSELDVSSSTDDDDDDEDDISLHIRDEACQTGDFDDRSTEPRLIGYYPIVREQAKKLGSGGGVTVLADEGMSVWRTLLHGDDSYTDVENIVRIGPCTNDKSFKDQDQSFCETADEDGLMSILISGDGETPAGGDGEVSKFPWCGSPHRLFKSNSSLVASVPTTTESQKSRTSSVPCILMLAKPDLPEVVEDDCSQEDPQPLEEIGVAETAPLDTIGSNNPVSVLVGGHLKTSGSFGHQEEIDDVATSTPCHSSSPAEEMVEAVTSESDVTVAIHSELPADAFSVERSPETHLPIPATETGKPPPQSDNLRAKAGDVHPPGVVCMDHQVCSLLADFVAHL